MDETSEQSKTDNTSPVAPQSVVPENYRGLPSEIAEEMMAGGDPIDETAKVNWAARKQEILAALREEEGKREDGKAAFYSEQFSKLSDEDRQHFPAHQAEAQTDIAQAMQGKVELAGLSAEEQLVVGKLQKAYSDFKTEHPDQPFNFDPNNSFSRGIDKRVYDNLVNRLAFDHNTVEQKVEDQEQANQIRREIGIAEQPLDATGSEPQAQAAGEQADRKPPSEQQVDGEATSEKEQALRGQVEDFLHLVANDAGIRRTIDKFRAANGTTESDMQILSKMKGSMYDLIHKSGMSYQEVVDGIQVPNKDKFVKSFNTEISGRLVDTVSQNSKVRHIAEKELIDGGQPDQAEGFVWFKGNAPRPANAREVRFYINASPDGTPKVAEYLSNLSDQLDQYGMRMQFKFRKDIGEYDRTDTCVAYLYMPEGQSAEEKANGDQWLETIKSSLAQIPQEALRPKNSFFTEKIADGLSSAEDSRDASSKNGESYTSQVTKSIAEACADVAGDFDSLTPESISQVSARATEKLKALNYI